MGKKTILLVDDEQVFLEALEDALIYEGFSVLKATTGEEALNILGSSKIDLVTLDIMMPPGDSLDTKINSHETGVYLCKEIHRLYPELDIFCISVVSNPSTVKEIQNEGVRFLRKGETPLKTVIDMIKSRTLGVAFSSKK